MYEYAWFQSDFNYKGGRYDGLSSAIGGPQMGGIGWAAGVERIKLLERTPLPTQSSPIYVITIS